MNELLKDIYQDCIDKQKIAEAKNAGLVAFNGAVMLTIINLLSNNHINCFFKYYLPFSLFCILVSIILNLAALCSILKHKELKKSKKQNDNLLYFGTIAHYSSVEYLNMIKINYGLDEKQTKYHYDLAKQIIINSQITLRKFNLFNSALKWTMSGIATPLSIIFFVKLNKNI
jgi:hypothetical protein